MTYNWFDQRASTWYEGYGPGGGPSHTNAGSFVDLSTLTEGTADYNTALDAVTNNIIGLFEQKGITAEQAPTQTVRVTNPSTGQEELMTYNDLINQAKSGDTKGAFQSAAAAVTSAADRGDLYGASIAEGGDQGSGASFLQDVADGKITATVEELYSKGLLREADTAGLNFHNNNLANNRSIAEIAGDFLASDEAQLQQGYSSQYGRTGNVHLITDEETGDVTVDHTQGLGYWIENNEAKDTGISDLQNFLNVTSYRGEDQDGDGYVSPEERLTSEYHMSAETMVRDDFQNILGQVSNKENRSNNPFFTDANNADVQRYVDHIRNARTGDMVDEDGARLAGVGNQDLAYDDSLFTNTHIGYRGLTMDALNQGDADDFRGLDLDGDGQVTGDEITANPTGMGRFGTVAEVKEYMDAHAGVDSDNLSAAQDTNRFSRDLNYTEQYGQKVFDSVHPKLWGAVTQEDPYKTYVTWDDPFGGRMTKEEAEQLLLPENLDHWKKNSSLWEASQGGDKDTGPIGEDGWKPDIPTKPTLPLPLPVDRKDINYMPNVSSDVKDTSGYGDAKTQFDQAVTAAAPDIRTAQGQAGQRFTGTSAKGVRMKRSKASRMGTIRGTKQLGREQQTKSLNI